MAVRKNVTSLSSSKRRNLVRAIKQLKSAASRFNPATSGRYDDYVYVHMQAMLVLSITDPTKPVRNGKWSLISDMRMPMWAHRCPAFLPWHRELLHQFERDLQTTVGDSSLGLPYWDWSVDRDPSALRWTDDFMGRDGNDGPVANGPFAGPANWELALSEDGNDRLLRGFGRAAGFDRLPTPSEVTATLNVTFYDRSLWSDEATLAGFRNQLEGWHVQPGSTIPVGMHNMVHLWVGGNNGSMLPSSSPNDPIFFLHHCNIDRLWAMWQQQHTGPHYAPPQPLPDEPGQGLHEPMIFFDPALSTPPPWNDPPATPAKVADHRALGYSYDTDAPLHPVTVAPLAAVAAASLSIDPLVNSPVRISHKDRFRLRLAELAKQ